MSVLMMGSETDAGAFKTTFMGKEYWMVETHKGRVLETYEHNGYDDSDFYARVWNDETGKPESVMYASTRGWTYANGATVDADDETKAKYKFYMAKLRAEWAAQRDAEAAAKPAKGKRAKTTRNVKGKNAIEAGVTGTMFWVGADKFSRNGLRVGFEADDGRKVFLSDSALEVLSSADSEELEAA